MTVGEMPGVTVDDAVLFTDPARREVDMVFQFEQSRWIPGPAASGTPSRCDCIDLKASLGRWQDGAGRNRLEQPILGQSRPAPRRVADSATTASSGCNPRSCWPPILHLHRGTPYVYQGEELGMTKCPFGAVAATSGTSNRSTTTASRPRPGRPRGRCWPRCALRSRDNARTPMQWDCGAGTPDSPPVSPGLRSIRTMSRSMPPRRSVIRTRCSRIYRPVIELRHTEPVVAIGDFTMLLPDDPHGVRLHPDLQGGTLLVLGNFSGGQAPSGRSRTRRSGRRAELVLGNYSADDGRAAEGPAVGESTAGETTVADTSVRETAETDHIQLRPWESRIYRRSI